MGMICTRSFTWSRLFTKSLAWPSCLLNPSHCHVVYFINHMARFFTKSVAWPWFLLNPSHGQVFYPFLYMAIFFYEILHMAMVFTKSFTCTRLIFYRTKLHPRLNTLFHQLLDCSIAVFVTTGSFQPTKWTRIPCALKLVWTQAWQQIHTSGHAQDPFWSQTSGL